LIVEAAHNIMNAARSGHAIRRVVRLRCLRSIMFPLGRTGIDTGSAVRRTDSDGSVDPGTVDDRARRATFARDWSWLS
jgi:hypothetical protein